MDVHFEENAWVEQILVDVQEVALGVIGQVSKQSEMNSSLGEFPFSYASPLPSQDYIFGRMSGRSTVA